MGPGNPVEDLLFVSQPEQAPKRGQLPVDGYPRQPALALRFLSRARLGVLLDFRIDDADFGPLFLKVCSYAPWGTKLCLNGHEWAKRQLEKKGIAYEALDNGFLSCAEPEKLRQICDSLGPEDIDRLFRKWLKRLPLPLRPEDRAAGYDWSLSIWQLEVSLTQIFDRVVTKKAPGLKFGQPRVMALLLALTLFQHLIDGFRNHDLRQHVADLLGVTLTTPSSTVNISIPAGA